MFNIKETLSPCSALSVLLYCLGGNSSLESGSDVRGTLSHNIDKLWISLYDEIKVLIPQGKGQWATSFSL